MLALSLRRRLCVCGFWLGLNAKLLLNVFFFFINCFNLQKSLTRVAGIEKLFDSRSDIVHLVFPLGRLCELGLAVLLVTRSSSIGPVGGKHNYYLIWFSVYLGHFVCGVFVVEFLHGLGDYFVIICYLEEEKMVLVTVILSTCLNNILSFDNIRPFFPFQRSGEVCVIFVFKIGWIV